MARAPRGSRAKTSVRVNFKNVESRRTPPEGDYPLSVTEAVMGKSGNNNDQIEFVLEISKGEYKGTKLWFYCPLTEVSLWKLHAFLTAMGEEVPEDDMDIDLPDLIGKELVGVLTHETYQGKKRAKMTDFDTIDNYKGGDDEEETKGKKKKKKGDEEEKPSKKDKGKKSKDEDEEEEEKPSKKAAKDKGGKKDKKKKKTYSSEDLEELDEKGLQKIIDEHDLEVDLDDFKKIAKKRSAVSDALEAEDLLED